MCKQMGFSEWTSIFKGVNMIHDSGKREQYTTGAVRDIQDGKGRFDLVPLEAIRRYALRLEEGATKYSEHNWEKGIPVSRCCSSALRHLLQYIWGYTDEDHLGAVLFNIGAIAHFEKYNKEMCDLPWQKEDK